MTREEKADQGAVDFPYGRRAIPSLIRLSFTHPNSIKGIDW